jgi:putative transposase
MQNLKYKYRLYPTPQQKQKLTQVIGCTRFVWNYFLSGEKKTYDETKKFNFLNKNSKELTSLKKTLRWLSGAPSTSLQQTLIYLDRALKQSFKSSKTRRGFPKFKKKKNCSGGFSLTMLSLVRSVNQETSKFKCPNIGWIKTKYHRTIPSDFKTAQIKWEGDRWYLVLTVQIKKKKKCVDLDNSIGIDLNSLKYVTSDGEIIPIPRFLGDNQIKIRRLQQRLSKSKLGSSNRKKWQYKLMKAHYRVKMMRLDSFHKLSRYLVDTYDVICIEDLNVNGIQKFNGHITKDNMMGGFREMLEYKCELYGKHLEVISRWEPTSQTCSSCGQQQRIPLSTRTYSCNNCGHQLSRDLNAALNIHRAGMARIQASGDAIRPSSEVEILHIRHVSMKEEVRRSLVVE